MMNALIIGKPFFNYHEEIVKEFKFKGYCTEFISDSPNNHLVIRKIFGKTTEKHYIRFYQNRMLSKCLKKKYDIILVLVGRYLSKKFLFKLKDNNRDSRLILYLWDDIARVENFEEVRDCYDTIYSFDIEDCRNNDKFVFLPLFFSRNYHLSDRVKKYTVYGSFSEHSDRKRIVENVYRQCSQKGFNCHFVFFPGRYKYFKDWFFNKKLAKKTRGNISFCFSPLSNEKNTENVLFSKALLDIQYPSQNGLTMRTVESIGAGVKIITTNQNIEKYDFYCSQNVLIIDRNKPLIDEEFLTSPYFRLQPEIYEKYSIKTWVAIIVGEISRYFLRENIKNVEI